MLAQWDPAVIAEWTLYLRNLRAKNKRRDLFRQVIQRTQEITKINLKICAIRFSHGTVTEGPGGGQWSIKLRCFNYLEYMFTTQWELASPAFVQWRTYTDCARKVHTLVKLACSESNSYNATEKAK